MRGRPGVGARARFNRHPQGRLCPKRDGWAHRSGAGSGSTALGTSSPALPASPRCRSHPVLSWLPSAGPHRHQHPSGGNPKKLIPWPRGAVWGTHACTHTLRRTDACVCTYTHTLQDMRVYTCTQTARGTRAHTQRGAHAYARLALCTCAHIRAAWGTRARCTLRTRVCARTRGTGQRGSCRPWGRQGPDPVHRGTGRGHHGTGEGCHGTGEGCHG